MSANPIERYLAEDFEEALKFYDKRAITCKRQYTILSIYLVVASAVLTPIIAFGPQGEVCRVISSGLSATIVVATGLLAHLKSHENWLSYRGTWDSLTRERRMYEMSAGPYNEADDVERLFVERTEAIRSREATDFYARHAKDTDQEAARPDSPNKS